MRGGHTRRRCLDWHLEEEEEEEVKEIEKEGEEEDEDDEVLATRRGLHKKARLPWRANFIISPRQRLKWQARCCCLLLCSLIRPPTQSQKTPTSFVARGNSARQAEKRKTKSDNGKFGPNCVRMIARRNTLTHTISPTTYSLPRSNIHTYIHTQAEVQGHRHARHTNIHGSLQKLSLLAGALPFLFSTSKTLNHHHHHPPLWQVVGGHARFSFLHSFIYLFW